MKHVGRLLKSIQDTCADLNNIITKYIMRYCESIFEKMDKVQCSILIQSYC